LHADRTPPQVAIQERDVIWTHVMTESSNMHARRCGRELSHIRDK